MPRISLTDQYDNRDVIAQIYRMLDQVATGTFSAVDVQRVGGDYVFTFTDQRGDDHQFTVSANYVSDVDVSRLNGVYTFLFTYADGTSESFGFTINGVKNIASVQAGSTVTVTFTLDDNTTKVITFSAGGDMTTDTAQTVTAVKTFTVSPLVPTAPAGSTDQTAANTNWISQTGNSAPNNLVHRTGNETIDQVKTFSKPPSCGLHEAGSSTTAGWRKLLVSPSFASHNEHGIALFLIVSNEGEYGIFRTVGRNNALSTLKRDLGNIAVSKVKMSRDADGEIIIWCNGYRSLTALYCELHGGTNSVSFVDSGTTSTFVEPVEPDYAQVITAS